MSQRITDRRAVIAGGALIAGSGALASGALARPTDAATAPWAPTAEAQDAWLDKPGTRHRLVFDTSVASAAESALYYADSFYEANKSDYGIAPEALGVVIILRHFSTPFAFNDAVWQKYGALLVKQLKLEGDKAERALKGNPLLTSPTPNKPDKPDKGSVTLTSLHAKGARYAVCALATKGMAGLVAKQTGQSADAVEKELHAAVVPGGVFMASGIVALNRAQEHGYAFAYVGE